MAKRQARSVHLPIGHVTFVTCSFSIPVLEFSSSHSRPPQIPDQILARREGKTVTPRILLADDDDAVRSMLQVALERDGFEVVAVAGVKDALSRIADEN